MAPDGDSRDPCRGSPRAETQGAVASTPNAVAACVERLQRSSDPIVREQAAGVLLCLSDAGRRPDIIAAGGVEALVELLRSGTPSAQVQAARAICSVADDLGSHAGASLGVSAIIDIARGEGAASPGREDAVATLHKLASGGNTRALATMAQSDAAIRILMQHLSADDADQQLVGVRSLRHLSSQPAALRAIVEGGGVPALVLVADNYSTAEEPRLSVGWILSRLAVPPHSEIVAPSGAVEVLAATPARRWPPYDR